MDAVLRLLAALGLANLGASLLRTVVPIAIGAAITAIATFTGVVAPPPVELVPWLTAVVTGAYYALLRIAERRWPKLGWLLGLPKQPEYPALPPRNQ